MSPIFSIVIVHYDASQYLGPCLRSVAHAAGDIPHEIIIVDNASPNGPPPPNGFRRARWIYNRKNVGWAAAINQGVQESSGEILLLLNPDTELLPSSLNAFLRFFEDRKSLRLGPVGGKLLFPNGDLQPSCGPFPHLGNLLWRLPLRPRVRRCYLSVSASAPMRAHWVSGAFMTIRRRAFDELGGMDAGFFLYYDDTDFCFRAQEAGLATYYLPEAAAYHHNPHCLRKNADSRLESIIQGSRLLYFKKHRPRWESWVLGQLQKWETTG